MRSSRDLLLLRLHSLLGECPISRIKEFVLLQTWKATSVWLVLLYALWDSRFSFEAELCGKIQESAGLTYELSQTDQQCQVIVHQK